ncbi:MAG: hypothetical protein Pars2KO_28910 [Parasphingorhabdus sp.]
MEKILGLVLKLLPLIFAIGFLVPVIAQGTIALGWTPPFGLSALTFALIIGGTWGLFAQVSGRWL